ncbi:MAG: amidohydrolase family protein, partial [Planctomycetales bacterium]|nr:amidohydrolase family protein [Planctomycetales bacterium]
MPVLAGPTDVRPPEGLRDNTPQVHALVGGTIVVAPGKVVESGSLVIRDGAIVAVGAGAAPPADARVWDVSGKTIYAGLIDAYSEVDVPADALQLGAPYWNDEVRAQLGAGPHYKVDDALNKKLRSQGITARLVAPRHGIIRGTSVLATTGDVDGAAAIVRDDVALHMTLSTKRNWGAKLYPHSPMGAVALARQAMYDSRWHREAQRAYNANHNLPRPAASDALDALARFDDGQRLVLIDGANELYFLRADRFAREFGLNAAVVGSGDEYRRLDAVRETGRAVIVPLNFPKAPNVATAEAALNVSLERLLHWDIAPENPARLEKAGVAIALTAHGLKDPAKFLEAVRTATSRGLSETGALAALTTAPAKLLGVDDRLGTLEVGRIANVVVADGPLFAEKTKLTEVWVHGRRFELKKTDAFDFRGAWNVTLASSATEENVAAPPKLAKLTIELEGEADRPTGRLVAGKQQIKLDKTAQHSGALTATFAADELGAPGVAQFSAVAIEAADGPPAWHGSVTWPSGARSTLAAVRTQTADELAAAKKDAPPEDNPKEDAEKDDDKADAAPAEKTPAEKDKPQVDRAASFAVNYPLGAFGVDAPPEQPEHVLFRGATVWTCGAAGVLQKADVLVTRGKIAAVGPALPVPQGALVVDAAGKHITPGVIDCHSHMATDGGVNEGTQSITAEVRIGDFIDPTDITIYRQLAGGVTAANILHGSANTIGGQNQVVKLRWGADPEAMKFADAPPGI